MARRPIPSYVYVLVVVRFMERYLLIRERKHGQTWYLPAGGVEPGESLVQAAVRETLEEAGLEVRPRGLLWFDHQWLGAGSGLAAKWRFVLVADPARDTSLKRQADRHSLEARWVHPAELASYPLRDFEVVPMVLHVDQGAPLMPLSLYNALPLPRALDRD